MNRISTVVCGMLAAALCLAATVQAAPDYKGKTLRLIVGTSPGGRLRHLRPGHCAPHAQTPAGKAEHHRPEHAGSGQPHRRQLLV